MIWVSISILSFCAFNHERHPRVLKIIMWDCISYYTNYYTIRYFKIIKLAGMGAEISMEDKLFELKFTAKQLEKQSSKMDKQEKEEKKKVERFLFFPLSPSHLFRSPGQNGH
jgi:hypothetical protein